MKLLPVLLVAVLLAVSSYAWIAPFIPVNEIHQAHSELEFNLIINENRNLIIILGVHHGNEDKQADITRGIIESTLAKESDLALGIVVDCEQFASNLDNKLQICSTDKSRKEKDFYIALFSPQDKTIDLNGHEMLGAHKFEYVEGSTSADNLAKKIRELVPDFVKPIQDSLDLDQFLQDTTLTKLIYFDETLLNPLYLKKIAARFYKRLEVGVCDNPSIVKNYGVGFGSIILLEYDFARKSYQQHHYTGTFDVDERPFQQIADFVDNYVLPNKSRDLLLDFELSEQIPFNFSSEKLLQKLSRQEKPLMVQIADAKYNCETLKGKTKESYSSMFNYVCFCLDCNNNRSQIFEAVKKGDMLLIQGSLESLKKIDPNDKVDQIIKPPPIKYLISTEKEADICFQAAETSDRIPFVSYAQSPESNFLLRYFSNQPGVSSIFFFCNVYLPDKFVTKRYNLKEGFIFGMTPEGYTDQGTKYKRTEHEEIRNYLDLKMFLREIAITKMTVLYQNIMSKTLSKIQTPQELTNNCYSSNCILALINTTRASRADIEKDLLRSFQYNFRNHFKFVWVDAICHKQLPSQFGIKVKDGEGLSALLFYNQKAGKYSIYSGSRYWRRQDLNKWLKSLRSPSHKFKKLKFSIDMDSRTCSEKDNDQL